MGSILTKNNQKRIRWITLHMFNNGALMGGGGVLHVACRFFFLKGNVACLSSLYIPMSHVTFRKTPCQMSQFFSMSCRLSISSSYNVAWQIKENVMSPCRFQGSGAIIMFPMHTSSHKLHFPAHLRGRRTQGSHVYHPLTCMLLWTNPVPSGLSAPC